MFLLKVKEGYDSDKAVQELENEGIKVHWSSEQEGGDEIVVEEMWGEWPFIASIESYEMEEINWEQQWMDFAPDIMEGIAVGAWKIKLKPGPGFGNLSHSTTKIMIELMEGYVEGKVVVDIGCGSGILGITAKAMGAEEVWAIDIDKEAILHTKSNAELNGITINIGLPVQADVWLINMILSEQKEALANLPLKGTIIASGLLDEKEYREWAQEKGWQLIKKIEREGWFGFIFIA